MESSDDESDVHTTHSRVETEYAGGLRTRSSPRFSAATIASSAKARSRGLAARDRSAATRDVVNVGRHGRKRKTTADSQRDPIARGASSNSGTADFPQPSTSPVVVDVEEALDDADFVLPTPPSRKARRTRIRSVPVPAVRSNHFPTTEQISRRSARRAMSTLAFRPDVEASDETNVHAPLGGQSASTSRRVLSPFVRTVPVASSTPIETLMPNDDATIRMTLNDSADVDVEVVAEFPTSVETRHRIAQLESDEQVARRLQAQFDSEAGATAAAASSRDDSVLIISPEPDSSTSTRSTTTSTTNTDNSSFDPELASLRPAMSLIRGVSRNLVRRFSPASATTGSSFRPFTSTVRSLRNREVPPVLNPDTPAEPTTSTRILPIGSPLITTEGRIRVELRSNAGIRLGVHGPVTGGRRTGASVVVTLGRIQATTATLHNFEDFIALAEHLGDAGRGMSQEQIDRLPTVLVPTDGVIDIEDDDMPGTSADASTVQDKCSICQDAFEACQVLRVIACVHRYHKLCIDQWLLRNASCPVCRTKITATHNNNNN